MDADKSFDALKLSMGGDWTFAVILRPYLGGHMCWEYNDPSGIVGPP